jgi:AraC-like DNA-binding protein
MPRPAVPIAAPSTIHPPVRTPVATTGAVATLLTPVERQRVDAAGEGCYVAIHRETVDEVLRDVQAQRAQAVLVSVARYDVRDGTQVARLVREFPRVPAVALLSASAQQTTHALLSLGQHGVRALVDVRDPRGWRDLRQLITTTRRGSIERVAIERIGADLGDAPHDCRRFFELLFLAPPAIATVRQFARRLGVVPSTFMSRFFRASLPAPKRYLAVARLVRAARLFENEGLSVGHVALKLEYSSPQSFSRHVQSLLHCSPVEFRRRFDGEGMLDQMRHDLVLPYLHVLRHFHPFELPPAWTQQQRPTPAVPTDRGRGSGGSVDAAGSGR